MTFIELTVHGAKFMLNVESIISIGESPTGGAKLTYAGGTAVIVEDQPYDELATIVAAQKGVTFIPTTPGERKEPAARLVRTKYSFG